MRPKSPEESRLLIPELTRPQDSELAGWKVSNIRTTYVDERLNATFVVDLYNISLT